MLYILETLYIILGKGFDIKWCSHIFLENLSMQYPAEIGFFCEKISESYRWEKFEYTLTWAIGLVLKQKPGIKACTTFGGDKAGKYSLTLPLRVFPGN